MKIVPFRSGYQPLVDKMLAEIQQEFEQPFTSVSSKKMKEANKVIGTRFWILLDGETLAGTVGVIRMKNASCALKTLFIPLQYRGTVGAKLLLGRVVTYAKKRRISNIYLGTMQQMKAAQKFYVKHGFEQVNEKDLPGDFPKNILDSVFYKLQVAGFRFEI